MFSTVALLSLSFVAIACAQQVGTQKPENHPPLSWQKCTGGHCQTQSEGAIVLDANWRWTHSTSGYTNCYTGNKWDSTLCPDSVTCAKNCALEGADYAGTYGIMASGSSLTIKFVTTTQQKNVGSRVYLMANDSHYEMFHLLNQEFTFDVDVSQLPCGINGALYFSGMDADGGISKASTNKAGAKYGTGYCDAQCPRDIKFINGMGNSEGWVSSSSDPNSGTGNMGTCCGEMDIWEANSVSTAYTAHPCQDSEPTKCVGTACGGPTNRYGSQCDPDGCDFNPFRMGNPSFYGKGSQVDTSKPFTVVTQFLTDDNTATGTLREIRRIYLQNGRVIQNSKTNIPGMTAYDSISGAFCDAQKTAFNDPTSFQKQGGLSQMGSVMKRGLVLVLSLWDDHAANMLWLDSNYPAGSSTTQPGVARGTCPTSSGVPNDVESQSPNAQVIFSNIKFGDIGSTFSSGS